jgi:nuclear pore complex protein Nup62
MLSMLFHFHATNTVTYIPSIIKIRIYLKQISKNNCAFVIPRSFQKWIWNPLKNEPNCLAYFLTSGDAAAPWSSSPADIGEAVVATLIQQSVLQMILAICIDTCLSIYLQLKLLLISIRLNSGIRSCTELLSISARTQYDTWGWTDFWRCPKTGETMETWNRIYAYIYVSMYKCLYIYISIYVYIYICVYAYTCAYMNIFIFIYVGTYITLTYAHTNRCICKKYLEVSAMAWNITQKPIYIYIFIYVFTYIDINTYIYICIYIKTYLYYVYIHK